MNKNKTPILEWDDATSEINAECVSKNLQLGRTFFTYNLPLSIHIVYNDGKERKTSCCLKSKIDMGKSYIVNYMPRKERTTILKFSELFIKNPSKEDLYDFTKVTNDIIRHLGYLMMKVGRRQSDDVYYPNCED